MSDVDAGGLWPVVRVVFAGGTCGAGVRRAALPVVAMRAPGARDDTEEPNCLGLGVMLWSADGRRDLRVVGAGVFAVAIFGKGAEASDMGGEGGSWISDTVSAVEMDFVSGGVRISGELAVEFGEWSKAGDSGMVSSVEMAERWRSSCFLILSWRMSASILRSESSSRNRCASTLRRSRSCSPILTSSSNMTALSIATLYLDSKSSKDDVVFRAWRSKSSFATSISRSFSCSVLLASRRVVISFSSVFCAAFASVLDSLYFLCERSVGHFLPPRTPQPPSQCGELNGRGRYLTFHSSTS